MSAALREERHYRILHAPVVTEKATSLAEGVLGSGKSFVFEVDPSATKPQVRAAVEYIFGVKVVGVRIHNVKGKVRNMRHKRGGRRAGQRPLKRKALVRLVDGQEIDFLKLGDS